MEFKICLAQVNIKIISLFDEVYNLCKDYLTDAAPDFTVEISCEDITFEREKSRREAQFERRPYIEFKDSYLETLAVYRKIAVGLLDYGAFLMHGAVVGLNNKAYMFTAPSGVGKTTHTKFWLKEFPDAFIVNGDKPIIKITDTGVLACGTPWAGKEGENRNVSLPLDAVCLLSRGAKNEIDKVDFKNVYQFNIGQTYRQNNEEGILKTMQFIKALGEKVRFYHLKCNLDSAAAKVAFDGIESL